MSLMYRDLALPPVATSRFTGVCDGTVSAGRPLDFSVYYVLPHYHQFGRNLRLTAMGGAAGGETLLFDRTSTIGEPLGTMLDPPIDVRGRAGLTFSCTFENDTLDPVYWGNRDGEMCMLLAFTDSTTRWAGGAFDGNAVTGTSGDGVVLNEAPCTLYSL